MGLNVWVDNESCVGSEHCIKLAPKYFVMKDGKAYVQKDGVIAGEGPGALVHVGDADVDAVIDATEKCEGECIFVEAAED